MEKKSQITAYKIAFVVGTVLMAAKFIAYDATGSKAILSDAFESIVNVVAAVVGIFVIQLALKPADKSHPYGHGKIEYFSAAFEGGLIFFAAILILIEAIGALIRGGQLQELGLGVVITIGAGLVNAAMGIYLVRKGKKDQSLALQASGRHLLTDFWTSAGLTVGLVLIKVTGLLWIDPVLAILVALHLLKEGFALVRESTGKLLDENDFQLIKEIGDLFTKNAKPGIIRIHHTRVIRSGQFHHIDAHVVVPEFWDVTKAHRETDGFERSVLKDYRTEGELHFHLDPCRKAYCRVCDVQDCPIRLEKFEKRIAFTVDELLDPEELPMYKAQGEPIE